MRATYNRGSPAPPAVGPLHRVPRRLPLQPPMPELAKSFDPVAIEARWAPVWAAADAFAPTLDPAKPSFSIQLPPPNVTGTLHMGHAFNQTIMDSLTRYHRMLGHN